MLAIVSNFGGVGGWVDPVLWLSELAQEKLSENGRKVVNGSNGHQLAQGAQLEDVLVVRVEVDFGLEQSRQLGKLLQVGKAGLEPIV
jgi:hypothetical protein